MNVSVCFDKKEIIDQVQHMISWVISRQNVQPESRYAIRIVFELLHDVISNTVSEAMHFVVHDANVRCVACDEHAGGNEQCVDVDVGCVMSTYI
jgi:hypothetical protein